MSRSSLAPSIAVSLALVGTPVTLAIAAAPATLSGQSAAARPTAMAEDWTTVRVVDARTGSPISRSTITVTCGLPGGDRPDWQASVVDGAGHGEFGFRHDEGRSCRVAVDADGHLSRVVEIPAGQRGRTLVVSLTDRPIALPELRVVAASGSTGSVTKLDASSRDLAGHRLSDWLRITPGVTVLDRGPGSKSTVSIRGSRAAAVSVEIDGVPINDPLTGEADLSLISTGGLHEVTVARGSAGHAGMRGGAGSLRLASARPGQGVRIGAGLGSWGQVSTDVSVGARTAGVDASVVASWERADNDFGFQNRVLHGNPDERRVNADYSRWGGLARLSMDVSRTPVRLLARVDQVERGAPGRMASTLWDHARWAERGTMLGAAFGGEARDPALAVSWAARVQDYRDGRSGRADSVRSRQASARGRGALPGDVRLSWEAGWQAVEANVVEAATRWTGGLALSREVALANDWAVEAAARADFATRQVGSGLEVDQAVSPNLLLRWSPSPLVGVWARAGQAFRLPTFADLYYRPGVGAIPNPELLPERVVVDAEIGFETHSRSEALELGSVVFYRETRDPIVWLPSAVAIWRPINAGNLRAVGLEADATWRPHEDWSVAGAVTVQTSDVRFGDFTTPLPYQPDVAGTLSLARRGAGPDARADIEILGSRRTNIYGPHELPAVALLNVRARQPVRLLGLSSVLELGVSNVLDVSYERVELYPEPGRAFEFRIEITPGTSGRLQVEGGSRSFVEDASGGVNEMLNETADSDAIARPPSTRR